jgi:predicted histidine transporter YuiF (NhaC family)
MPNKIIDQPEFKRSKANDLLETMMDVMENIQYIDDAGFALRMKVLNNIEFLVDVIMEEYEQSR